MSKRWLFILFAVVVSRLPAGAIINPKFTPTDLVRTSTTILLLDLKAPGDRLVSGQVVEATKGKLPPEKAIKFSFAASAELTAEEVAAPFNGADSTTALLLLGRERNRADDTPSGLLLINTQWFAVFGKAGDWRIEREKRDMFSVWAGSAPMLARAARYVESDPAAAFPVKSLMTWGLDLSLGQVQGKVNGCFAAQLPGVGLCVIILSDGGDRVFQIDNSGKPPVDVTTRIKIGSASKVGAVVNMGQPMLARWNGATLELDRFTSTGQIAGTAAKIQLDHCLSIGTIETGQGAALLIGTPQAPLLLTLDAQGVLTQKPLAQPEKPPGEGGLCTVADFDRDGRADVLQFFNQGAVLYLRESGDQFKTPRMIRAPLVDHPRFALCGDYDADGQLDAIVAGNNGLALLMRNSAGAWETATPITGELAYHGNANQPRIISAVACDVNNDGRQGAAFFYPDRNPLLFFNRGFACFGLSRELELNGAANPAGDALDPFAAPAQARAKAADALQAGQSAGTVIDINGDGVSDLLGVDLKGNAWALLGKGSDLTRQLRMHSPTSSLEPITVTVLSGQRTLGMYVVNPHTPVAFGRGGEPLTLEWVQDGKIRREEVAKDRESAIALPR